MPWKAPQIERCPKCQKAVYANESRLAAGNKFHIMCFKCTVCNKMLESTTVSEHDGQLYCKSCHGKQFGPKGYGYGGGAGTLSMDTGTGKRADPATTRPADATVTGQVVEGGCPRCGKRVYEAEKKVAVGKDWHKSCFNCNSCHKSLDSTNMNDNEGEIFCKGCYGKLFGPKGIGYGIGAGALSTS